MEPVTVAAVVSLLGGLLRAGMWMWVCCDARRSRVVLYRELARGLPSGSRVVDLGERGVVVEVGAGADRGAAPDAGR